MRTRSGRLRWAAALTLAAAARAGADGVAGGLEFARIPVSIREQAAGSAYGADDVTAAFTNPALLTAQGSTWSVAANDQSLFAGNQNLWTVAAGYAPPGAADSSWGLAALVSGYSMPAFNEVDGAGNATGTRVAPGGFQGGVAGAYRYGAVSAGAGLRDASESFGLADVASLSALLVDLGVGATWKFLEAGVSWRGLGGGTVNPSLFNAGAAARFGDVAIGLEVNKLQNGMKAEPEPAGFSAGVSARVAAFLDLRVAAQVAPGGGNLPSGEGSVVRPGLTVRYGNWSLDYATSLALAQGPGITHQIGMGWAFGAPARSAAETAAAPVATAPAPSASPAEAAAPANPMAGSRGDTLAVGQFDPQGVSATDAAVITDMFRNALVHRGAFRMIEKANMDKILSEQAFQQTGCTSSECAVKLGKILNVKYLVVGNFGKLLDEYVLGVRVVEVETAQVVYSDQGQGHSSGDMQTAIDTIAERLTAAVTAARK